jgi:hypothetical protein
MSDTKKTRRLVVDPLNPILALGKQYDFGSLLKTFSPSEGFSQQILVPSVFEVQSGSPQLEYKLSQPTQQQPRAMLTVTRAEPGTPLIVKLTITARYRVEDGQEHAGSTLAFVSTSPNSRDTNSLIIYGEDQKLYFVDMSTSGKWQVALLGDRSDLDPDAGLVIHDGTTATWLQPGKPPLPQGQLRGEGDTMLQSHDVAVVWCYVLNLPALSATRPESDDEGHSE